MDRKGRFQIGLKLLGLSGLSPGFFRIGVIAAILRDGGTMPEDREEVIVVVMSEERAGSQALTKLEGMGSRVQVAVFVPVR